MYSFSSRSNFPIIANLRDARPSTFSNSRRYFLPPLIRVLRRTNILKVSFTSISPEFMDGKNDPAGLGFGKVLKDQQDFYQIAHADGLISIGGFGSLLSEKSARYTFPDLQGFRLARLRGFRRVFAHVAPIFFERGIANLETKEISSVSAEPSPGNSIIMTVFEIKVSEVPAFIEREHEFRFLAVTPESLDGLAFPHQAVVCCRSTDEEYRQISCKGSEEEFHRHYGIYNIEKIWRDDILPCRLYLRHCVLAAKNLGDEVYANFLDHSYLGDRRTTIREYLSSNLTIMNEEPPPLLRERYGG